MFGKQEKQINRSLCLNNPNITVNAKGSLPTNRKLMPELSMKIVSL